jgi:hypothetical protein
MKPNSIVEEKTKNIFENDITNTPSYIFCSRGRGISHLSKKEFDELIEKYNMFA